MDRFDDARDVAASLLLTDLHLPRLGIADVVEMNAIDIIVLRDLLTDVG